jgi:hypothetical protein
MRDYSLHDVATRPAKIEDRLVTTKFYNSITRGFAAVGEARVAVCLLPGTELAFDNPVECEPAIVAIFPSKKIGQRVARFRQINVDKPSVHHDALEFPDGQVLLLTSLCNGQHATVLQMPAAPRVKTEADEHAPEAASEPLNSPVA